MGYVSNLARAPRDNEIVALPVFVGKATYDFAIDGGAVGDIPLGLKIPNGALVLGAYINVLTPVTGNTGATLALKLESAADINAADAVTGQPWSTTGWKLSDRNIGAQAPIKLTAERELTATVGTAALTAGKFEVLVIYTLP